MLTPERRPAFEPIIEVTKIGKKAQTSDNLALHGAFDQMPKAALMGARRNRLICFNIIKSMRIGEFVPASVFGKMIYFEMFLYQKGDRTQKGFFPFLSL